MLSELVLHRRPFGLLYDPAKEHSGSPTSTLWQVISKLSNVMMRGVCVCVCFLNGGGGLKEWINAGKDDEKMKGGNLFDSVLSAQSFNTPQQMFMVT
jgi:hypothetical protein